jgi:hypothetical protein
MKSKNQFLFFLIMFSMLLICGNVSFAAEKDPGHRVLIGTVEKIASDSIFIKTKEGTTRTLSKSAAGIDLANLKVGDQVELEFNEQNMIIDIDKITSSETGAKDMHKVITGALVNFNRSEKTVTVKLKGGSQKTFKLKDAAATKLGAIKQGTEIVMEIDEENAMAMEVHPKQ